MSDVSEYAKMCSLWMTSIKGLSLDISLKMQFRNHSYGVLDPNVVYNSVFKFK